MILLNDDSWEVKKVIGKGKGIFVKKNISKKTIIGDYLGIVLRPDEAIIDEGNFYLMYYHDHAVISPELNSVGVQLLNNSCDPNAWFYIYKGHTLVFAMRDILKGEEVTIPYLLPPITKFCNPCQHKCLCGSLNCRGTMHMTREKYSAWREFTENQSKETKRERIRYGENLKQLLNYPIIPQSYINQLMEIL